MLLLKILVLFFYTGVSERAYGSPDPRQRCARDFSDVLLPFKLPLPDEHGVLSVINIVLQHTSGVRQDMLAVNICDLTVKVDANYAARVGHEVSVLENTQYIRLSNATVDDDGLYKCYHHDEAIHECEIKLNIDTKQQKPIVNKSWYIFETNHFNVTCEDGNFDHKQRYPYHQRIQMYKRSIPNIHSYGTFQEVASYMPKKDIFAAHGPGLDWTFDFDSVTSRLTLVRLNVDSMDSGEYACVITSSVSEKSMKVHTFGSLISMVNVRAFYQPTESDICQDATVKDAESSATGALMGGILTLMFAVQLCCSNCYTNMELKSRFYYYITK